MPVVLASLIDVNPGLIFWTLVTFAVVIFVLGRVAWGPILGLIEEREKAISDAIESAKRERAEAERLLAEQKSAVADARREAAENMKKNRDDVEKFREELMAKSKKDAEELVASARRQILEEKSKAVAEVRVMAVDLAIGAASKLLGQSLDESKHRQLVSEYIEKLPKDPLRA
jgi:F-type H+-transporting ATPase subunit b